MTPIQLRLVRWSLSLVFIAFGSWVGFYLHAGLTRTTGTVTPDEFAESGERAVSRDVQITQLDSDGEVVSVLRAARSEGRTETSQLFSDVEIEFAAGDDETPIRITGDHCELRADKSMYLEGNVVVRDDANSRLEAATLHYRGGPERAWSDDPVRFFREFSRGSSDKMRYYLKRGNVELEGHVRMVLVESGEDPVRVRSQNALMRRNQQRIRFIDDVFVRQNERSLRANDLVLHMRDGNEQIEMAEAFEQAELLMNIPAPEPAELAEFDLAQTQEEGDSDESLGDPSSDEMAEAEESAPEDSTEFSVRDPGKKRLTGDHLEFVFQPDSDKLQRVRAVDGGRLSFEPPEGADDGLQRVLDAHLIAFDFDEEGQLNRLRARGGVTMTMTPVDGLSGPRVLTARQLEADFDPVTGDMTQASCSNAVEFTQGPLRATGERGTYDLERDELTLEDEPALANETASLEADVIVIESATGAVVGTGNVKSTSNDRSGPAMFPGGGKSTEPVFFLADRVDYNSVDDHATYAGAARGMQGENTIEARQIELYGSRGELFARGNVRTVFYQTMTGAEEAGSGEEASAPAEPPKPTITLAKRFTYESAKRVMQYRREVDMRSPELSVTGDQVDLKLGEVGDSVEEVEVNGGVVIKTADADAEGDYAKYLPASDEMRVTGDSAKLRTGDKLTLGKQLIFFLSNDRVLIDGLEENRTKTTYSSKPRPF